MRVAQPRTKQWNERVKPLQSVSNVCKIQAPKPMDWGIA